MEDDEDVVVLAEIRITRKDPYDYFVYVEASTLGGDYSTTTMGATSIKDAAQRAANWLGE
jgi:hypothetical protein